jgi:TDG/mug DNA glycosylase family protein
MSEERNEGRVRSFPPVVDGRAVALVLGSMPGRESLLRNQYYGNARNYFWPVLYGLFGEVPDEEYDARLRYAQGKGFALWDVIASCRRKGSLDANIRDERPNDIPGLLAAYPGIRCLAFNGAKAYETFRKHFGTAFANEGGIGLLRLPSTSPIPTPRMRTLEDRIAAWRALLPYLAEAE